MARRKVLVAGASGVVGYAAVQHFASLGDWDVVGIARRPPAPVDGAELRSLDLMDAAACEAAAADLADVTHLVYAALFEKPGLIPGWFERDQMETNLTMLRNLFEPLARSAAGLEHVSLMQGTKAYGAHVEPMTLPGKEDRPRHQHENFYWLQEDYLREKQAGQAWAMTILRPQIIFGDALGSNMNAIPALGVYAALLRKDGEPLHFPGGAPFLTEAVDADLLARALAWAATTPECRGETFNITNGDVFVTRNCWPTIADAFGMEPGDDVPVSLSQTMPGRQDEWAEVVQRFDLVAPVDLGRFVGQSFIYADLVCGYGLQSPPPPTLLSTIKARRFGFTDCIDTEDMFRKLIARLQDRRLLPPREW